ncbi:MAG: hypothetical protein ABI621_15275 [Chloroflexota bacterium]
MFISFLVVTVLLLVISLFIMALSNNWSLVPPPKERDFRSALADWAEQRELAYVPQRGQVISGVYNNRWFTIGTTNEENALRIRMRVKNPQRTSLQIFGDWLEDSGVIAFVNRFRVYGTPSGFKERLFEHNTQMQEILLRLPGLRARMDLFSDPKDPNHLHYSLLTDLPAAETLDRIMDSMCRFCEAFEQQTIQEIDPS